MVASQGRRSIMAMGFLITSGQFRFGAHNVRCTTSSSYQRPHSSGHDLVEGRQLRLFSGEKSVRVRDDSTVNNHVPMKYGDRQ